MLVETAENLEGTIVEACKWRLVAVTSHIHVGGRVEIRREINGMTAMHLVGTNWRCCIEDRSLYTKEVGSSIVGAEKKSPGRRRVVPYTISAEVQDRSSLRVA